MDYAGNTKMTAYEAGAVSPSTFLSPLADAHDRFGEVADRLERLAERLCGSVPNDAASKLSTVPAGTGLFGEVADRGRDMGRKADRAIAALNRIENMLP